MNVVKKPTPEEFIEIAESLGMSMSDEDVASYLDLMTGTIEGYNLLAEMPDYLPVVKYPRTVGAGAKVAGFGRSGNADDVVSGAGSGAWVGGAETQLRAQMLTWSLER